MTSSTPSTFAAPILVVEDSDEDFDSLREAAAAAGVTRVIHRGASGSDCLAMLRGEGDVNLPLLPALIVMDLNSHGVDGREALVAIKTDARLKEIPVVVLTTSGNPRDVEFCYRAGANAYHVKPVRHDQYSLLLRSLMHYWLESVTLHESLAKVD
ncbi:response regulator [Polaromonas sp.]|uniref:response regulator n=1 Tax=Polaromonas sp. TaxID=1869339 RepID=UPI0035668511